MALKNKNVDLSSMTSEIESILDCAVCFKYMDGNIYMCASGHPVCEKCMNSLQGCHTCTQPFIKTRVLALEHISELVYRRCESDGCGELFTTAGRGQHMLECTGRVVACIACDWRCALDAIGDHVMAKHRPRSEFSFFAHDTALPLSFSALNLTCGDTYGVDDWGRVFEFRLQKNAGCVWFCARVYDTKPNADRLRLQLLLSASGGGRDIEGEFKMTANVHTDLEHLDGLCVPLTSIEVMDKAGWIDDHLMITITCRVFDKTPAVKFEVADGLGRDSHVLQAADASSDKPETSNPETASNTHTHSPVDFSLLTPHTAEVLARLSDRDQRQTIGEWIYPLIQSVHQNRAGKLIGMLVDLPMPDLLRILPRDKLLWAKVKEAVAVLEAQQKKQATAVAAAASGTTAE